MRSETHADTRRALQELQIHQIELELQNEELQQSKLEIATGLEKYTDLYDFAPVGYCSLTEQGLILETNHTLSVMLGLDRHQLINRRLQLYVAPASLTEFNAFLARVFSQPAKTTCETSLFGPGKTVFWADLEARLAVTPAGNPRWCRLAVIDVAARKEVEQAKQRIAVLSATNERLQAEIAQRQVAEASLKKSESRTRLLLQQAHLLQKQLRASARQVLLVQETQRKEISQILHDEISQLLLGIDLHLVIFSKQARKNPAMIRSSLVPLRRLVAQCVARVHRFARELRPSMLDELGLIAALGSYVDDFPKHRKLRIRFTASPGVEALDNLKKTMLYRVAQEALSNVAKHARASRVTVALSPTEEGFCLEIADNGRAFDVAKILSPEWGNRLGLISMRERVEMVGGRFSITSTPVSGTTVRVIVPSK